MSPTASSTSASSATDPNSPGTATNVTDPLANESTFLTLLVSQLQNQDPLDPVDSNQFVSQLTAYSQLEQLIGIHQNTTTLSDSVSGTAPTSNTTTSNTTGA
jgi:flagellar basal-body rod modification protein FlgD